MTGVGRVEVHTCFLCGREGGSEMFRDGPWRVLRCDCCGLVRVTPRLGDDALRALYGEDYWSSDRPRERGYADYRRDEPLYLRTFRRRFAFIQRHAPRPGRALDVGCAAGYFLSVLRERGWEACGVELSAAMAEEARRRLPGCQVHTGTIETAPWPTGSFDLVTMWDVVEHVPDPLSLLRSARGLLAPGGLLLLETQNVDSLFARILGRRWQHYKHQEHLYHFNPATVARLLSAAGFSAQEVTRRHGGKYVSMDFIVERSARVHPVLSALLRPLRLFRGTAVYVNLRDELVVAAKPAAASGAASAAAARAAAGS